MPYDADFQVRHQYAETTDVLYKSRNSKYLQCDLGSFSKKSLNRLGGR